MNCNTIGGLVASRNDCTVVIEVLSKNRAFIMQRRIKHNLEMSTQCNSSQ